MVRVIDQQLESWTYFGEPLNAFCEFRDELGPINVPRWITVVQRADLVMFSGLLQFLQSVSIGYPDLMRPFLVSLPL